MRGLVCVLLIACGGGDGEVTGDPLIQSTLTAEFNNKPWTPMFGFGRMEESRFGIYLGSDKISCADDFEGRPRNGTYAAVGFPGAPTMMTLNGLAMNLTDVVASNPTMQLSQGSLMITAVTEADVSAVFAFDLTISGGRYAVNGAVTMLRCP